MSLALVFPGQGSQSVGMGRAMADACPEAREVFARVDSALGGDALSTLCFEGPEDALTLTANAQPAILAASLACLAALRARLPSLSPSHLAGHSLGEYSALVASGALALEDAARLVRLRGEAMQSAVAPGVGAMTASLLLDDDAVEAVCAEVRAELPGRALSTANVNAPGQVVIAGHADAVARAAELIESRGGKAMSLKVSAPFHCALMEPAARALDAALAGVSVGPLSAPVVSNVEASPNADPSRVRALLVRQVTGAVRWREGVARMVAEGVDTFVEVGPGRVLSGLIKRTHRPARVFSVGDPEGLDAAVAALS